MCIVPCTQFAYAFLVLLSVSIYVLDIYIYILLYLLQFSSRTPRQIVHYSMRTFASVQRRLELGPLFLSIAAESKTGAGILSTGISWFRKVFPVRT